MVAESSCHWRRLASKRRLQTTALHDVDVGWRADRSETVALKRREEEQLVFYDRAAEDATKLVKPQRRFVALRSIPCLAAAIRILPRIALAVQEELIGVKHVIAHVLPGATVEIVGARLGHEIVDGTCAVSILR